MKLNNLTGALLHHFSVNPDYAVWLWGSVGIGKTTFVQDFTDLQGRKLVDVRASQLDPVDVRGLPITDAEYVRWLIPNFLHQLTDKHVLFLDELNLASPSTQSAFYSLIQERKLGDYTAPEGLWIIAAGNREQDGCGVTKLKAALSDRFEHIDVEFDLESWTEWARQSGVNPLAIAASQWKPELVNDFDPKARVSPTPRSFVRASRYIDAPKEVEFDLIQGSLGEGAALTLEGFIKIARSLGDPKDIFEKPKTAEVPEDIDTKWALIGVLSREVNEDRFSNIITYLKRWDEAEFLTLFVRQAEVECPTISQTVEYQELVTELAEYEN